MCPPAMPALFEAARGRAGFASTNDGGVVGIGPAGGAAGSGGGGRMGGVVGEVCVELVQFFLEVGISTYDTQKKELQSLRRAVRVG